MRNKLKALALWLVTGIALANPQGGSVVHGSATFSNPSSQHLQINQSTDKAIINWQQFNIQAGEHTQFIQPSKQAIILNRVIGGDASHIFGKLSANGRLMLVNPRGIWFGPGAVIDAASLIATTNNISDQNFINSHYVFDPIPENDLFASVINDGTITVSDQGMVALMAPGVANHGVIQANLGQVVLASGNAFTLDFYGDDLINFSIDKAITKKPKNQHGEDMTDALVNSGAIYADGGKVVLSARAASNVVENSINMSGYIQANRVAQSGGKIHLLAGNKPAHTSKIKVTGRAQARSGQIWMLANRISVADSAEIDIRGEFAELLIGGDRNGLGLEVPLIAESVSIGEDVSIKASGENNLVVVYAKENLDFYAHVDLSGANHFIETSAKHVSISPSAIQFSPTSIWYLDPIDQSISTIIGAVIPVLEAGGTFVWDLLVAGAGSGIATIDVDVAPAFFGSVGTLQIDANQVDINASVCGNGPVCVVSSENLNLTLNSPIVNVNAGFVFGLTNLIVNGDWFHNTAMPIRALGTHQYNGQFTVAPGVSANFSSAFFSPVTFNGDIIGGGAGSNISVLNQAVFGGTGPINITGLDNLTFNTGFGTQTAIFNLNSPMTLLGNFDINGELALSNPLDVTADTIDVSGNIAGGGNSLAFTSVTSTVIGDNPADSVTGLDTLSVSGGAMTLNSGNITSTGTQTYNATVTQINPVNLTASAFNVNASWDTNNQASTFVGDITLPGNFINLDTLTLTGNTTLDGMINIPGAFVANGPVTLTANTIITAPTIDFFDAITGGGFDLTLNGTIILDGTFLTTHTGFNDVVFNGPAFLDFGQLAAGNTVVFNNTVNFNAPFAGQAYQIIGDTTFSSTVDGDADLQVTGDAIFNGQVGATTPLNGYFTGGANTTINTDVFRASGLIDLGFTTTTFNQPLLTITSTGFGNVRLGTIDGSAPGANALVVDSFFGTILLGGNVGNTVPLASFTTPNTSALQSDGGLNVTIQTTGNQTYSGPVNLNPASTLYTFTSTGGTVNFINTLDALGTGGVQINGNAQFDNTVGAGGTLTTLDVTGTSLFNGASVATTGAQTYLGNVTQGSANLTASASGIAAPNWNIANNTLVLNAPVTLPGFFTNIGDLTLNAASNLNGIVNSTVALTSNAALTLLGNSVINAPVMNFNNNIIGGGFDLTLNGPNTFNGAYTGFDSFSVGGLATLLGPTSVVSSNGITFNGLIAGGQNLTLDSGVGDINFNGVGASALGSLTVNNTNNITLTPGATLNVSAYNQLAGTGSADFGTASLNAGGGPVSVITLGNITGHIIGGTISLFSTGGGTLSADVVAGLLNLFGFSGGALTGSAGGLTIPTSEPFFGGQIFILGGSGGLFTFNGFEIGFVSASTTAGPDVNNSNVNPYQDDESSYTQERIEEGCQGLLSDEYQDAFEDVFGSSDLTCF